MRFFGLRTLARVAPLAIFAFGTYCFAQNWAVGVAGGYGVDHDATVKNATGSADAGFESRFAVGAVLTQDIAEHIGGELRYTYRDGNSELSSNGREVNLSAASHIVNYDVLFYATPRRSRLRPYVAAGAGITRYDADGRPVASQPLSDFAVLTHNHQVEGMASVGGGVKVALNDRWVLRVDFRDYLTPFPQKLIAPPKTSSVNGWLQDFVPTIGVEWTFGGR